MAAYYPMRNSMRGQAREALACSVCAQGQQVIRRQLAHDLTFPDAFEIWISWRTLGVQGAPANARYIKPRTARDYRSCARALGKFPVFSDGSIGQLKPEDLMDYQAARAINLPSPEGDWWCHRGQKAQGPHGTRAAAELWAGRHGGGYEIEQSVWAQRAGGNRIRKEITLMVRILTDAHLWGQEQELGFLRLRPEESDVARAMTIAEQHRFLHVSASRLAFRTIYQYAIVALQTTASPNELRELRLCDVLLDDRIIQVPPAGAKNPYRFRAIPLVTEDAMWALEGLLERARVLG